MIQAIARLFLSRGRTVKIVECRHESLNDALTQAKSFKLSGRAVIKSYSGYPEVHVEFLNGELVACRSIDERGNVIEGKECLDLLMKRYAGSKECIIEVIKVPNEFILVDLREYPNSLLKETSTTPSKGSATQHIGILSKYRIECLNTNLLISILKSAKLLKISRGIDSGVKLLAELTNELRNETTAIYVRFKDSGECRVVLCVKDNVIYVSCIRENKELCGEECREYLSKPFGRAYVMILKEWPC